MNDKELTPKKKKQKHAWRFEDGSAVEMSWDRTLQASEMPLLLRQVGL